MRLYAARVHEPGFESDYHTWLARETNGSVRDTAREIGSNSWLACPWTHPENLHPNVWTAEAAIELLARRDTARPFFLQVGFHRPHPPLDPPWHVYDMYRDKVLPPVPVGDWAVAHDHPMDDVETPNEGRLPDHVLERTRKAYYAQITHLDVQIGKILFRLGRLGQRENTWIIFASDHGEMLGDHHLFRKANGFEGSARIPFVVRPPAAFDGKRGATVEDPVALMDLMPTILAQAGVPVPDGVEGADLAPLLRCEQTDWRAFVHGEHTRPRRGWQFVTDGKEKFIWDSLSGEEWFFDLVDDPGETCNRAGEPTCSDRVDAWRGRLVSVLAERPQDGLTEGGRLVPGRIAPTVRPEVRG
jgi:arylsulfatase A-like enzyme